MASTPSSRGAASAGRAVTTASPKSSGTHANSPGGAATKNGTAAAAAGGQEQVGGSSPSKPPREAPPGAGASKPTAMDMSKFTDDKLRELVVKSLERAKRAEKELNAAKEKLKELTTAGAAKDDEAANLKRKQVTAAQAAEVVVAECAAKAEKLKNEAEETLKQLRAREAHMKQELDGARAARAVERESRKRKRAEEAAVEKENQKKKAKAELRKKAAAKRVEGLEEQLARLSAEKDRQERALAKARERAKAAESAKAAAGAEQAVKHDGAAHQTQNDEGLEDVALDDDDHDNSAAGAGTSNAARDEEQEAIASQLGARIVEIETEIEGVDAVLASLQEDRSNLINELLQAEASVSNSNSGTTAGTTNTVAGTSSLDSLQHELEKSRATAASQETLALLRARHSDLLSTSSPSPQEQQTSELQNEHTRLLKKHESELADIGTLFGSLQSENTRLDAQLKVVESDHGRQREQIWKSVEQELASLDEKRRVLEAEKAELGESLSKLVDEEKKQKKEDIAAKKLEMQKANEVLEASQREIGELGESLTKVAKQIELAKENLHSMVEEDRVGDEVLKHCEVVLSVELAEGQQGTVPTVWQYVYHRTRAKGYWLPRDTVREAVGDKNDNVAEAGDKDNDSQKPLGQLLEKKLKALDDEESTAKATTKTINEQVDSLQAEFLEFRQSTATALQINSSLRTGMEEQEKMRTKQRFDLELLEHEKDAEVRKKEENVEQFEALRKERADLVEKQRHEEEALEKLQFDIEQEQFNLSRCVGGVGGGGGPLGAGAGAGTASSSTGSAGAATTTGINISTSQLDDEMKKREINRLREDIIPPLEASVQLLRTQVREQEDANEEMLLKVSREGDFSGEEGGDSSASVAEEDGGADSRDGSLTRGRSGGYLTGEQNSSGGNYIPGHGGETLDIRESGLYQSHELLSQRKRKLLRKLPVQAYTLHPETAEQDIQTLRNQVESLDKRLTDERAKIQQQYGEILENKKKFRQIQGLYLAPTKEMEYVQNIFRKFALTLPAESKNKSLLPVLYKFFNCEMEAAERTGKKS
eukprot:g1814.t1